MTEDIQEGLEKLQLQQCSHCNRSFKLESLEKHEKVCQNVTKKRPIFNSSKQRAVPLPEDYDGPKIKKEESKPPVKPAASVSKNPETFLINGTEFKRWPRNDNKDDLMKWKDQVESEMTQKHLRKVPSKSRSWDGELMSDRGVQRNRNLHRDNKAIVECPHCLRKFKESSAERHMKFCEEMSMRMPVFNDNWDAKWKLAMRTRYQPPSPKRRRGSTSSKRSLATPPRRSQRKSTHVVEEGVCSKIPDNYYNQKTSYTPVYNTYVEPINEPEQPTHFRKPTSKMVTYGAVQPFSGPAIAKNANKKSRFKEGVSGPTEGSLLRHVYMDREPSQVQLDIEDVVDNVRMSPRHILHNPETVSAQMQTESLSVPQFRSSNVQHPQTYMVPSTQWPTPWTSIRSWPSEDAYLQAAPKIMAPAIYYPPMNHWPQYSVLPDVVPRVGHNYATGMMPQLYRPSPSYQYEASLSPRNIAYHQQPNYQPRYQHQLPALPDPRNFLTRDDTLLEDDAFSSGGPHVKTGHKFCGNCGAKYLNAAVRYCCDCGALNDVNK